MRTMKQQTGPPQLVKGTGFLSAVIVSCVVQPGGRAGGWGLGGTLQGAQGCVLTYSSVVLGYTMQRFPFITCNH